MQLYVVKGVNNILLNGNLGRGLGFYPFKAFFVYKESYMFEVEAMLPRENRGSADSRV